MLTTLETLFASLFNRDAILARARQLGAVRRERAIHPYDMLLALVSCAVGDEHRSIATARRQFQVLTNFMPEESSFYDRFTPGLAGLAWELFLRTLATANRAQRREVARALGVRVRDVRVVDASVVTLPAHASANFPSTDAKHGGFKMTTTLSVLADLVLNVNVTDAKRHDRKAFELPPADQLRDVLWMMDRAYSDHRLFAAIDQAGGFFIIRLKTSSMPTITTIRSGVAASRRGQRLDPDLPVFDVVDIDARFTVGNGSRVFRVVGIPVAKNKRAEADWIWLVTNLPPRVTAKTIGAFYRLRWTIENLFRVLKSVGRLDELRSGKPAVVHAFIAATLIGLALSHAICAAMRAVRPRCEPSLHRVFAVLLANFATLVPAAATGRLEAGLPRFVAALWREGLNPNPGRPYARRQHLLSLGR